MATIDNRQKLLPFLSQVEELKLSDRVRFLPSFTDAQRAALLAAAVAVVYTPENEHFGIVPIEAMASGVPVVACNSGGPTESVAHGVTGLLCDPTPAAFAAAFEQVLGGGAGKMGVAARERVRQLFSRGAFGDKLDGYVRALVRSCK